MVSPRFIDLHLHTIASDGDSTAKEVVRRAYQLGLTAISITDHDSVNALDESKEEGKKVGLEVISGIELSAYEGEAEVHILGYLINDKDAVFLEMLNRLKAVREKRILSILEKLKAQNVRISAEEVFKLTGHHGAPGRLHVARVLVQQRVVSSTKDAFNRFLAEGKAAYVPKEKLSVKEAIGQISRIGGLSVLAHPGLMNRDELIPSFVRAGLHGIEVYHSEHSPSATQKYIKIAKQNELLMTGGSDCHGMASGKILIGSLKVPYELLEKMKVFQSVRHHS